MAEWVDVSNPATPFLRNYEVPIPGSDVTVCLGVYNRNPFHWFYSLWDETDNLISQGSFDTPYGVRPDQVGRIAFLLDIEYAKEN